MAGGSQDEGDGIISAINVTPLVDITLVLLIIMMVTAKIIVSAALPLDLPKAAKGEDVQLVFGLEVRCATTTTEGECKTIGIRVDGEDVADDKKVLQLAREGLAKNKELRAVIRADEKVQHGSIIRILDLLKQAGVTKIAFGVTPVAAETEGAPAPEKGTPAPAPDE
jgi:biopolymer transport protein ExbD